MKTLTVLLGLLFTIPAFAQQAAPLPDELKAVDYMVGHWDGNLTMAMAPGQDMKMKASMDCDKILGGRYIRSMHKYSGEGMPEMSGMFLLTYDGTEKDWAGWWYDSTAAGSLEMRGQLTDNAVTIISKPTKMEGMGEVVMRSIWTKVSDTELKMQVDSKQGDNWVTFVSGDFKKK